MGDRQPVRAERGGDPADAARKRAAIELIHRHEATLRRTARRYSLCADDAEDALQRSLEILLTKAPTADQRDLIRWMQTVTKHEALAIRRVRERNLGPPSATAGDDEPDWVQLIPSEREGPADAAERRERIRRAGEALQALKPQELRALTLLAERLFASFSFTGKPCKSRIPWTNRLRSPAPTPISVTLPPGKPANSRLTRADLALDSQLSAEPAPSSFG